MSTDVMRVLKMNEIDGFGDAFGVKAFAAFNAGVKTMYM